MKRWVKGGNNIIDAIEFQALILADKSLPKDKRAEALTWVVHLIGDAHQPLHGGDRNGDKGGNTRLVFWLAQAKAISLHQVWDTQIVSELVNKRKTADAAGALSRTITSSRSPAKPARWRSANRSTTCGAAGCTSSCN